MGFRFRKSVKIAPGIKLNFNKKSTSVSFGGKGATYTVNSTGKKTASVGIPGTGLYYTESVGGKKKGKGNMFKKAEKAPKVKKPLFKKPWLWIVLVGIVFSIATGGGSGSKKETTPQVQTSVSAVSGQRDEVVKEQEPPTVTTEPEEVKPVEPVTEEPKEETQVVIAENATTKETTKETKQVTEEVVEPHVEEPVIEEPVVEEPPVVAPVPEEPVVEPEPEPVPEQQPQEQTGTDYVLNTNKMKFHYPSCNSVKQMSEKNKAFYTGSREDVIARGYSPCGNCKP